MKIRTISEFKHYNEVATTCRLTAIVDSPLIPEGVPMVFIGKTKVRKGDTYDEVTGERIAESKALLKLYKHLSLIGTRFSLVANRVAKESNDELANITGRLEREIRHYEKLTETNKTK